MPRTEQLEFDHLAIREPRVQILAGELEMLIQAFQDGLGCQGALLTAGPVTGCQILQSGYLVQGSFDSRRRFARRTGHLVAFGKPMHDLRILSDIVFSAAAEGSGNGWVALHEELLDRLADDLESDHFDTLLLALIHHLDLAGQGWEKHPKIADTWKRGPVPGSQVPTLEIGDQELESGDGKAGADTRCLVHQFALSGCESDLLDQELDLIGDRDVLAPSFDPGLLASDVRGYGHGLWVVSEDLGRDPVLEWGDDGSPIGVVLRVGREDHQDIEWDPDRESTNLQISFLQDIQQTDLDSRCQIGELVDGEDAPIGSRDDAEVNDLRVGIGEALCGGLDGIDVAEEIGDGDIRCGELLVVARFAG